MGTGQWLPGRYLDHEADEHDLYYIENWTLGFDFKIMFLTVFKGFYK